MADTTKADATTFGVHSKVDPVCASPGVVHADDHNSHPNGLLRQAGMEVAPIAGTEPGRGRGGGRGMTWPIMRDAVGH